jgi:hypothetical protein
MNSETDMFIPKQINPIVVELVFAGYLFFRSLGVDLLEVFCIGAWALKG